MWRRILFLIVGISIFFVPVMANATSTSASAVVIVELSAGSLASANEEFVEIYNTSEDDVSLAGWELQYFSSTKTDFSSPYRTAQLDGTIYAGGRLLISSPNYLNDIANFNFSGSGISADKGTMRLAKPMIGTTMFETVDVFGWGATLLFSGYPSAITKDGVKFVAGKSYRRQLDSVGHFINTNNNNNDFLVDASPTPESSNIMPPTTVVIVPITPVLPPVTTQPPAQEIVPTDPPLVGQDVPPIVDTSNPPVTQPPQPDQTQPVGTIPPPDTSQPPGQSPISEAPPITQPSVVYLPVQITELLPNPASPQTDAADEYLELYNPNLVPVNLLGYQAQTGNSYSYSYTFPDTTLQSGEYRVFYIRDTGLVLSNTAGIARLLDPNQQVVSTTGAYTAATEAETWALVDGVWLWTTTPTPNAANAKTTKEDTVLSAKVAPVPTKKIAAKPATVPTKIASSKASTATTPKAVAKTVGAKVASVSTTAKKAASVKAPTTPREVYKEPPADAKPPLHTAALASMGLFAVGYLLYEYRQDMAHGIYRIRRYRALRRAAR